ncbi:MAG: methylmalonyl-CoA epimerase [Planctomycetes bacterium]|nr:methylmalonyl-CoA epimerase [Planctomycetota bacterium]
MKLDHVGIAVKSIQEARPLYEKGLCLPAAPRVEEVAGEKVRVLKLEAGDPTHIELIEPLSEDSPIAKFIANRGPGIHHLCFVTDDIARDSQRLKDMGLRMLGEGVRQGADGMSVVFFHPKDTFGVLTELAQHAS